MENSNKPYSTARALAEEIVALSSRPAPKVAGLTDAEIEAIFHKLDGKKIIKGVDQLNWNAAVRLAFVRSIESALAGKKAAELPDAPDFETADKLMALAQEFASSWSIVGSRFDSGNEIEKANAIKAQLRASIESALAAKGDR